MEPSVEHRYHLFGDLWLEAPENHLSAEELEALRQFQPLIFELENRAVSREDHSLLQSHIQELICEIPIATNFNLAAEFKTFADREQAVWGYLGFERPREFLV